MSVDAMLDDALTSIERGFNIAGSIPIVSVFSGVMRCTAAKVQVVAGFSLACVGIVGSVVQPNDGQWAQLYKLGEKQFTHGLLNLAVGIGECFLGATGVGSLILLASRMQGGFDPVYKYQPLFERKVVPLAL